jgi:hypothetical protein
MEAPVPPVVTADPPPVGTPVDPPAFPEAEAVTLQANVVALH